MKNLSIIVLVLGLGPAGSALASDDKFSKDYGRCMDQAVSTFDILECTQQELEKQDARLNAAYKKLRAAESENQKKSLLEAQRAWIKFRDTWGNYLYDPEGGTMARVAAATWNLEATVDQAIRLEQSLQPE